jgi:hypothetical protein
MDDDESTMKTTSADSLQSLSKDGVVLLGVVVVLGVDDAVLRVGDDELGVDKGLVELRGVEVELDGELGEELDDAGVDPDDDELDVD